MLQQFYNPIKEELKASTTTKDVQWFNNQYEDTTILQSGINYIEFPDSIEPEDSAKDLRRSPLRIRIHVVTKVVGKTGGGVSDAAVEQHEEFAMSCRETLEYLRIPYDVGLTNPLVFVGWKHYHKWRGWMVTFIDFTTRIKIA